MPVFNETNELQSSESFLSSHNDRTHKDSPNSSLSNIKELDTTMTDEVKTAGPEDNAILRDCVRSVLTNYINDLEGHTVDDLYQLVLAEVEAPLLETILGHTNGNQSKAAQMLGINRGTLRKKLKQYNIND